MNNLPVLVVVFRVSTSKFYCRAPKEWLKAMHGERAEWREQPNYAVLVDTRDRPAPQLTYVPQENIEVYTIIAKIPDVARERSLLFPIETRHQTVMTSVVP